MRNALVVGIDHYEWSPLEACINDANSIGSELEKGYTGKSNFSVTKLTSDNIRITKPQLFRSVRELFSKPAEVAFLFFSGHGGDSDLGGYLVTEDAETVNTSHADYKVTANTMYNEFVEDDVVATEKYKNKVVEITGIITGIAKDENGANVSLATEDDMNEILCRVDKSIAEKLQSATDGASITLKGEFSDYDDDIIMARCDVVAQ